MRGSVGKRKGVVLSLGTDLDLMGRERMDWSERQLLRAVRQKEARPAYLLSLGPDVVEPQPLSRVPH
jgi:hypothetical protein